MKRKMLKASLVGTAVFTALCLFQFLSFAADEPQTISLNQCHDEKLGIRFLCNPDWGIETEDDVFLVVISKDPSVTFTITRSDSPVVSLEQLTNKAIQTMGQYREGFSTQMKVVNDLDAIYVVGEPEGDPGMALNDVYLIHRNFLYALLFSVSPKEQWQNYNAVFDKIIQSVQFAD